MCIYIYIYIHTYIGSACFAVRHWCATAIMTALVPYRCQAYMLD